MTKSTIEHSHERSNDGKGSYASVNGLTMYYEIHGTGKLLVLLHGGLATIDTVFGPLLPPLAQTRQIIAVELQARRLAPAYRQAEAASDWRGLRLGGGRCGDQGSHPARDRGCRQRSPRAHGGAA